MILTVIVYRRASNSVQLALDDQLTINNKHGSSVAKYRNNSLRKHLNAYHLAAL